MSVEQATASVILHDGSILTYDPVEHKYFRDGKPVCGVSEASQRTGFEREFNAAAELAALRGTNVHKYTELRELGQLDNYEIDPAAQPYLAEYDAGVAHLNREMGIGLPWSGIEQMDAREVIPGFWLAGRMDRVSAGSAAIVDIKTSKNPTPAPKNYRLKMALYAMIFQSKRKILLYLTGSGKFDPSVAIQELTNPQDDEVAREVCHILLWRKTRA